MIKFFKKIRYDLVEKNKTGKYLKYAIGEIVLVVIGILIALQINNWNEHRKLVKEELNMLIEVKSNLEVTLDNFKKDTLGNLNTINQFHKIEQYIKEDLPYNSELDTAFARLRNWWSPYPISTAYTTLKTKGLDIISNVPLRNKIVNMYEFELTLLSTDYDRSEWNLMQTVTSPFYSKFIRVYRENSNPIARPNDFESLKSNNEFSNILGMIISNREMGLKMYKKTMIDISDLINSIENELVLRK